MALLMWTCWGLAIYCFINHLWFIGILFLLGPMKKIGMWFLVVGSGCAFVTGHYIVGAIPIALIIWNVAGYMWLKKSSDLEIVNEAEPVQSVRKPSVQYLKDTSTLDAIAAKYQQEVPSVAKGRDYSNDYRHDTSSLDAIVNKYRSDMKEEQ